MEENIYLFITAIGIIFICFFILGFLKAAVRALFYLIMIVAILVLFNWCGPLLDEMYNCWISSTPALEKTYNFLQEEGNKHKNWLQEWFFQEEESDTIEPFEEEKDRAQEPPLFVVYSSKSET